MNGREKTKIHRKSLEKLYRRYNRREFVCPDPVEFLYRYDNQQDREIAGLIASSLAYGRVLQIIKSVDFVLKRLGSPSGFLHRSSRRSLQKAFSDFKHRFTTGEDLSDMLFGMKRVLENHGSLLACFVSGLKTQHQTVLPALSCFVKELKSEAQCGNNHLLPSPEGGSACKRLNLFLRWMVRRDEIDPGGWKEVPSSKLIVPLDTHMHRICLTLKLTKRKQADGKAAIEITDSFRQISPTDPVRYDFSLTRLGIRKDADLGWFLNHWKRAGAG